MDQYTNTEMHEAGEDSVLINCHYGEPCHDPGMVLKMKAGPYIWLGVALPAKHMVQMQVRV